MPPKVDNVQRLLQAEEKRNKMVADAKAEKAQRIRQAKVDAERDVADFRAQKERELNEYAHQQSVVTVEDQEKMKKETEVEIKQVRSTATARLNKVSDLMVEMITTVSV